MLSSSLSLWLVVTGKDILVLSLKCSTPYTYGLGLKLLKRIGYVMYCGAFSEFGEVQLSKILAYWL